MRVFIILAVFAAVAYSAEDLDYTPYFKDEGKLKSAIDCLLDKVPCGDLQGLRDKFPILVKDECASCESEQKTRYEIVKKILQDNYPEYYKALKDKYAAQ